MLLVDEELLIDAQDVHVIVFVPGDRSRSVPHDGQKRSVLICAAAVVDIVVAGG